MSARMAASVLSLVLVASAAVGAEETKIESTFVPDGVTAKVGGYRPIRAEMDREIDDVTTISEDLVDPKVGAFEFGERSWLFVLEEPEDEPAKLFVDANGDGDLTNDPEVEYEPRKRGDLTTYFGSAKVHWDEDQLVGIKFYRFDPEDKRRSALKNTMLFYADFGYQHKLTLEGEQFTTYSSGEPDERVYFRVDRDGNGQFSSKLETIRVGRPFNFTGTTYVVSVEDGKITIDKAEEEIDLMPLPPNLSVGQRTLEFTAKSMDGEEIEFPSHYKGKIVMLDFWATWCGPCIGEVPHMKKAYEDWHDAGFEILGISFDSDDQEERINKFLTSKEIPWSQIYEGGRWDTRLGVMHDVSGIPFVLLIDGDSGKILATRENLRGEGLSEFIGEQLEKKKGE